MVSTWWYVPNLIGYARIITGLWSLVYAFDQSAHHKFFMLYAISYGLDAVDGVAARALKQTSRFGALLDMVTDRFCTAALLAVLAHLYPECHVYFLWLMVLDIVSHWAQMYRCDRLSSATALTDSEPLEHRTVSSCFVPVHCGLQLHGDGCELAQEHGG
jgi:phosphatidylglycerophosphate synthase